MSGVSDVSQWRITPDTPATSIDDLDYERCAALHNHIVELGWVGAGRDLATMTRRTWWEEHGAQAEEIHDRLAPSLVQFLRRAYVSPDGWNWSFHYYLSNLMDPETFFESPNDLCEEYEEDRFIWLYNYGWAKGHTNGLIFDQVAMAAIIQPTIEDADVTMNGRQRWQAFEYILDAFINIIEHGKIEAVSDDYGYSGPPDRQRPWVIRPYSDYILERTITAFNDLTAAIQERRPNPEVYDEEDLSLADEMTIEAAQIIGFTKDFLWKARRPNFKYIAPGITIQSAVELMDQPFRNFEIEDEEEEDYIGPILLFRSEGEAVEINPNFSRPFEGQHHLVPGLYIAPCSPTDANTFGDGTRFILPFPIGVNGFAKAADGGLIGEARDREGEATATDMYDGLYTAGYNPYIENHDTQLYRILENWTDMVKEGYWEVDQDGVRGGIQKFREADVEEYAELYVLELDW